MQATAHPVTVTQMFVVDMLVADLAFRLLAEARWREELAAALLGLI